jgi:hypothetical protein
VDIFKNIYKFNGERLSIPLSQLYMRMYFLLIFLFATAIGNAQQYHCEYNESMKFKFPDSVIQKFRSQMMEQGLTAAMADQVMSQMAANDIEKKYFRIVDAHSDSTFILIKQGDDEGPVKMNMKEQRLLLTREGVYAYDEAGKNWVVPTDDKAPKVFRKTENKKKILSYDCIEYQSTDSTCNIWVASSLPSYINPGVRTGSITGAVLAFERREKDMMIRSEISRLGN